MLEFYEAFSGKVLLIGVTVKLEDLFAKCKLSLFQKVEVIVP